MYCLSKWPSIFFLEMSRHVSFFYVHGSVSMYVSVYMYLYICILHVHTCIYIYVYMAVQIYMYVYICIILHKELWGDYDS